MTDYAAQYRRFSQYRTALLPELVLTIQEKPKPSTRYRAIELRHDWPVIVSALPELRIPSEINVPPDGWLLIDPDEDVAVGWTSSLDDYEVIEC